jgi:hypothetical protein
MSVTVPSALVCGGWGSPNDGFFAACGLEVLDLLLDAVSDASAGITTSAVDC